MAGAPKVQLKDSKMLVSERHRNGRLLRAQPEKLNDAQRSEISCWRETARTSGKAKREKQEAGFCRHAGLKCWRICSERRFFIELWAVSAARQTHKYRIHLSAKKKSVPQQSPRDSRDLAEHKMPQKWLDGVKKTKENIETSAILSKEESKYEINLRLKGQFFCGKQSWGPEHHYRQSRVAALVLQETRHQWKRVSVIPDEAEPPQSGGGSTSQPWSHLFKKKQR